MNNKHIISREELEGISAEDLAEQFKEHDLEVCVEPLSEWGSDLEALFQKLEKSVMQWYDAGSKRSFTICFLDEATAPEKVVQEKEAQPSVPLATPAVAL
jgi:hypothetical protein